MRITRHVVSVLFALALVGCGSIPNRNPVGESFPPVAGTALSGERVELPAATAGSPAVYLIAYRQNAQFDADRWLLGLLQSGTPAMIYEVPTIRGWAPRAIGGWIDEGMRGGIPPEDWSSVVTVYRDGNAIARFTGDTGGQNVRVLLLDDKGTVRWFHDAGYSARVMVELDNLVRSMESSS